MIESGVGGSPFTERNFHPHTTRRFNRRTKEDKTTPVSAMTSSGKAHQMPKTLCQFQSRAFAPRPERNQKEARHMFLLHFRGTQSTMPRTIKRLNSRLATPVSQRPMLCEPSGAPRAR